MDIRIPEETRAKIEAAGADPDFVWFLMGWTGLLLSEQIPFIVEKESEAYRKKLQRKVKRDPGVADWKQRWKEILNEKKKLRKLVLRQRLFHLITIGPKPPHRPPNLTRWMTVELLRSYFKNVTGTYAMGLIAEIIFHDQSKGYEYIGFEWQRRKRWFATKWRIKHPEVEADMQDLLPLENLLSFYVRNKVKVIRTLESGIPLYRQEEFNSSKGNPKVTVRTVVAVMEEE